MQTVPLKTEAKSHMPLMIGNCRSNFQSNWRNAADAVVTEIGLCAIACHCHISSALFISYVHFTSHSKQMIPIVIGTGHIIARIINSSLLGWFVFQWSAHGSHDSWQIHVTTKRNPYMYQCWQIQFIFGWLVCLPMVGPTSPTIVGD